MANCRTCISTLRTDANRRVTDGVVRRLIDKCLKALVAAPASVVVDSGANTDVQRRREDDRALFELAQTRP
jgi:hypothetical protein